MLKLNQLPALVLFIFILSGIGCETRQPCDEYLGEFEFNNKAGLNHSVNIKEQGDKYFVEWVEKQKGNPVNQKDYLAACDNGLLVISDGGQDFLIKRTGYGIEFQGNKYKILRDGKSNTPYYAKQFNNFADFDTYWEVFHFAFMDWDKVKLEYLTHFPLWDADMEKDIEYEEFAEKVFNKYNLINDQSRALMENIQIRQPYFIQSIKGDIVLLDVQNAFTDQLEEKFGLKKNSKIYKLDMGYVYPKPPLKDGRLPNFESRISLFFGNTQEGYKLIAIKKKEDIERD